MKILVALIPYPLRIPSIDAVLSGQAACSGSVRSMISVAALLQEAGHEVTLSLHNRVSSQSLPVTTHAECCAGEFDKLIVNHNHWCESRYTFPKETLSRTILSLRNAIYPADVYRFFQEGGSHVVCLSKAHAAVYRQLPQWPDQVSVIPNTYPSLYQPAPPRHFSTGERRKLLFIGALARGKGFVELTQIWTYLARRGVDAELHIAGSQRVHEENVPLGPSGLVDAQLEEEVLAPWLKNLPATHQPVFLGAISSTELRDQLKQSWAAIVNPGLAGETFCVAAAEAQACNRSVFSVKLDALEETIYTGHFNTLGTPGKPLTVAERIIEGLENPAAVEKNGEEAGEHVRKHFGPEAVKQAWLNLLEKEQPQTTPLHYSLTTKDRIREVLRRSGLGVLSLNALSGANRRIMRANRQGRNSWA